MKFYRLFLIHPLRCDKSLLRLMLHCVFVYYYCMCLKSHTFIFLFLLGVDNVYLFFFYGSSLIGLYFPPSFVVYCFCSCDVRSDLVYTDVCSDLLFGEVCSILLPTMRSEIFCSLSLLIVVTDGRVPVICHNLFHRWISYRTDVILIVCNNQSNCSLNIYALKTLLSCFLICGCHRSQQLRFSQHAFA